MTAEEIVAGLRAKKGAPLEWLAAAKIESDAKVIAALREASTETLAALDALEVGDGNTRLSAAMAKLRTAANEQNVGKANDL